MPCEGDLTSADLDDQSTSAHTLSRVSAGGESKNLYPYIDLARCHGVNLHSPDALQAVLRPHNERDETEEEKSLVNLDEDDGVMLNVIFSEMCRVKSVLVSAPPSGDERVARCRIWVNRPHGIDLADADDVPPDQEFELLEQERGAVEYPVRVSRFANVSSLTVNFVGRQQPGHLRLFYLGFKGASRSYQKEPGQQLSVAAQNSADAPIDGIRERSAGAQTSAR